MTSSTDPRRLSTDMNNAFHHPGARGSGRFGGETGLGLGPAGAAAPFGDMIGHLGTAFGQVEHLPRFGAGDRGVTESRPATAALRRRVALYPVGIVHPGQMGAGVAGLLSLPATGLGPFRPPLGGLGGSGLGVITRWWQRRVARVLPHPVLQVGDASLEAADQCPQFGVLRYQPGVLGGQGDVLGHQPGALDDQIVVAVGALHNDILVDPARSVVDRRALRATQA